MLIAPFLAVVMALVIAGAVVMVLPPSQPDGSEAYFTTSGINGASPTAAPQAASAADLYFLPSIIALTVIGIIVGLAAVLLFFRREPQ
jgi:hypothetical protein